MKKNEFIEEMESAGLFVIPNTNNANIYVERQGKTVAVIKNDEQYNLKINLNSLVDFDVFLKNEIYNVLVKYAQTPLAEREEEKKYHLLSSSPLLNKRELSYLNLNRKVESYTLNTKHDTANHKTIFTESEIAGMDITGFEKVEVADGE